MQGEVGKVGGGYRRECGEWSRRCGRWGRRPRARGAERGEGRDGGQRRPLYRFVRLVSGDCACGNEEVVCICNGEEAGAELG